MHFERTGGKGRRTLTVVEVWSGGAASALRSALRLTNEQFAQQLGTGVRTVAKWNAESALVPTTEMQRAIDTLLLMAGSEVQERFAALRSPGPTLRTATDSAAAATEVRLADDIAASEALSWLDEHVGWVSGTARRRVAAEVDRINALDRRDHAHARTQVGRAALAEALSSFYAPSGGYERYRPTVAGQRLETTILTRPEWLDLALVLGSGKDDASLLRARPPAHLSDAVAEAAISRIAHAAATRGRMDNAALYDLQSVDLASGTMTARFAVSDFLSYALTLDLLEAELVDAVAAGVAADLPLREQLLPDVAAVVDIEGRLCAGGPVCLFAAARSGSRRNPNCGDYVFLVQQRSARTLNANRRLAVIPKAFHQPLADFADDAQLSATIEREMEEELFGRDDLDVGRRRADPMHPARLTEPMRWLMDYPAAWRVECTAFGLNLVSGNYEFANLIVIEDEAWWDQFSGSIEANWEADGLRRYSTLDREGIAQLVHDDTWSNEALFALLEGLRRLAETGGARVDLPPITMES